MLGSSFIIDLGGPDAVAAHYRWLEEQLGLIRLFNKAGINAPLAYKPLDLKIDLNTASQAEIDRALDPFLEQSAKHPGNPHFLTCDTASHLTLIHHSNVHAMRCLNTDRDTDTKGRREFEAGVVTKAFMYSQHPLVEGPKRRVIQRLGNMSTHFELGPDVLGDYKDCVRLADLQRYLKGLFTQVTMSEPARERVFIGGVGTFGNSLYDNLHTDQHELSLEEQEAQYWQKWKQWAKQSDMVFRSRPRFIMLENIHGAQTEAVANRTSITRDDLDRWEAAKKTREMDRIAAQFGAEPIGQNVTFLFKTTEAGISIEDLNEIANVHRRGTMSAGEGRLAFAYTNLDA